jgi:hypothetical protein
MPEIDEEFPPGYIYDRMVMILCDFDIEKYEWYANNCDVSDFVKVSCYKKYDDYIHWLSMNKDNNTSNNKKNDLDLE